MKSINKIDIEVVYASSYNQSRIFMKLNYGVTVKEAIYHSGILDIYSNINLKYNKVGIYGELVKLSDIVVDGDRIEIYRSLITDPKTIRTNRLNKKKYL